MPTTPDEFDYEIERSRAAVTIACLQWLRCTGPATPLSTNPARVTSPDAAKFLPDIPTIDNFTHDLQPPHPLWDRWIDG